MLAAAPSSRTLISHHHCHLSSSCPPCQGNLKAALDCCSSLISFLKNKKNIFYSFWLHWIFVALGRLSLVVMSRGYSLLWCTGFSLQQFSCCRAQGLGTQAQQLGHAGSRACCLLQSWCTGSVVTEHRLCCFTTCRVFWTRNQTHVPCSGRQTVPPLYHQRNPCSPLISKITFIRPSDFSILKMLLWVEQVPILESTCFKYF